MKFDTSLEGNQSEAVICSIKYRSTQVVLFFFCFGRTAWNWLKNPGARCAENVRPPKKWVCDDPQMKCPRKQLNYNDPVQLLAFLCFPRSLSEFIGARVTLRNQSREHPS